MRTLRSGDEYGWGDQSDNDDGDGSLIVEPVGSLEFFKVDRHFVAIRRTSGIKQKRGGHVVSTQKLISLR